MIDFVWEIWESGKSWNLGIWEFGNLGIWEFGDLGIREFGNLGIWEFGNLGIWESGNFGNLGTCIELGFCASIPPNTACTQSEHCMR